jgi:hypothetical protein
MSDCMSSPSFVISIMQFTARITLVPLLLAGAVFAAETSSVLPKESPFVLRGGSTAPVATPDETIEFAGVSSIGDKTDLIFYDKTSKKSHWISTGETKEGIAVMNYDDRREEVVVKVNGVQKTLALRKGKGPTGIARPVTTLPAGFNTPLPAPLPAPVSAQLPVPAAQGASELSAATETVNATPAQPVAAPAAGSPAEIQTRQETEARMLVSDLLEIGMAQRRAYEEAQRKAAGGSEPNAGALPTPQVTPAQPAQPVQ